MVTCDSFDRRPGVLVGARYLELFPLLASGQREMIAAAERAIYGLDNSKFGRRAQALDSPSESRHTIVTDTRPKASVAHAISTDGAKLMVTGREISPREKRRRV